MNVAFSPSRPLADYCSGSMPPSTPTMPGESKTLIDSAVSPHERAAENATEQVRRQNREVKAFAQAWRGGQKAVPEFEPTAVCASDDAEIAQASPGRSSAPSPGGLRLKDFGSDGGCGQSKQAFINNVYNSTGYRVQVDSNGVVTIPDRKNVNYQGTSGTGRELLRQIIDNQNVTTTFNGVQLAQLGASAGQTDAGIRSQNGLPHALLFENLNTVRSQNRDIANEQFLHEMAEGYSEAKGGTFHETAHPAGVSAEHGYSDVVGSVRDGCRREDHTPLKDEHGHNYGYSINYSRFKYMHINRTGSPILKVVRRQR